LFHSNGKRIQRIRVKKREFRREYHWEKDVWLFIATNLSTEVAQPSLVPKGVAVGGSCLISPSFLSLLLTPASIRQSWAPPVTFEAFGFQKNVNNFFSPDRLGFCVTSVTAT